MRPLRTVVNEYRQKFIDNVNVYNVHFREISMSPFNGRVYKFKFDSSSNICWEVRYITYNFFKKNEWNLHFTQIFTL